MNLTETKEKIMNAAFDFTAQFGLEGLTIGELAKTVGMSKSGLFGHFKSKERLQLMVLDFTSQMYTDKVIRPAIKKERGIPRIEEMVKGWTKWGSSKNSSGCPFITAAIEFDDRPGKIRDRIQKYLKQMMDVYAMAARIAIEEGQFHRNTNTEQFAYELYSLMIGQHVYRRLLNDQKSEDKLINGFSALCERAKSGECR